MEEAGNRLSSEATIRVLEAKDLLRLVRMDEAVSGRRRQTWYEGKLKRALEDADVRVSLGADVDGTLVGALLGSVHYGEFGQAEPVAILDTILVDPAFARRGIATQLLGQLLDNLRALRIKTLRTQVGWSESDMIAFFSNAGFEPSPHLVLAMPVPATQ